MARNRTPPARQHRTTTPKARLPPPPVAPSPTAGPRPLISRTEAVFTGSIDSLVRGASGDDLAIDGSNLTGLNFIAISPSQSISNLSIRDVDLQNGVAQASYAVALDATTGARSLTIASPYGPSSPFPITIADPTPRIDSVLPANPWPPGQVTTVTLTGSGFGLNPKVVLQVDPPDSGECLGFLGSLDITPDPPAAAGEQDRRLVFRQSVPANSSGCRVRITVVSNGLSGNFLPASGRPTNPQSGSIEAFVRAATQSLSLMKIFIVHGLGDNYLSMRSLAINLAPQLLLDRTVDYTYNHTDCTSIDVAADALAAHVMDTLQSGNEDRVAFIGHSMGGLIIRKMLALKSTPYGLISRLQYAAFQRFKWPPAVKGMATLGTPHVGYPFLSIDTAAKCGVQVGEMRSSLRESGTLQSNMSPFLRQLESDWRPMDYNHQWFAAAGRACSQPTRSWFLETNGCPDYLIESDGVVCDTSARAVHPDSPLTPSSRWFDTESLFQHSANIGIWGANVMCPNQDGKRPIVDPQPGTALFNSLKEFLNAL